MKTRNPSAVKFEEIDTASRYIRKKYHVGSMGIGFFKLDEINKLKDRMVDDHSESEIVTIKTSIDAQFEHYKQLTSIIAILALIFTMIFTTINAQISYTMKPIDWIYNLNQAVNTESLKGLKLDEITTKLTEQTNQMTTEYLGVIKAASQALQMNIFTIGIFLFVLIYIYFGRFRWIVLVKNVTEEALKEKKRQAEEITKIQIKREVSKKLRIEVRNQRLARKIK
ncbi:hypothetical protein [Paenibacillus sp. GCM10012306]|uniref:hypothetical protein n=1 Tax=Paenibacillus sp. GCM10012306 TaxID=3317342 RepID=UPI00361BC9D1